MVGGGYFFKCVGNNVRGGQSVEAPLLWDYQCFYFNLFYGAQQATNQVSYFGG